MPGVCVQLRNLRLEQRTGAFRRWDVGVQGSAVSPDETGNRRLEFVLSSPACPAGRKMQIDTRGILGGKFPIRGEKEFLIRKMTVVTLHSITVRRRGRFARAIFPEKQKPC